MSPAKKSGPRKAGKSKVSPSKGGSVKNSRPKVGPSKSDPKSDPKSGSSEFGGVHAYAGLDRVLHEKARLGMLTALVTRPDGVLFTELKDLCHLTDGNLSRHVSVLQESGLVEVWKGHGGGRPQTLIRLSADGREQFLAYVSELEQVIRDARSGARNPGPLEGPAGWQPA